MSRFGGFEPIAVKLIIGGSNVLGTRPNLIGAMILIQLAQSINPMATRVFSEDPMPIVVLKCVGSMIMTVTSLYDMWALKYNIGSLVNPHTAKYHSNMCVIGAVVGMTQIFGKLVPEPWDKLRRAAVAVGSSGNRIAL